MATESKIEQELLKAGNLKPKKKTEDLQKYLTKMMLTVAKLPDAEWEGLSNEAQEWVNGAAKAHKSNKTAGAAIGDEGYVELVDFPDYEEIEEPEQEEEVPEAKPEPKAKPKAADSAPQAYKKVSACHTIKKIVAKKPKITVAELSEKLKEDGLKVSDVTIATLRSDVRDTLRVLNELRLGEFVL